MKSIVRCRRLSATLVVTFNTLGLQRSTAVCPAACPAGMRRLGMYQVEPRLEVAGLVHGRRVDSGPVVIERTILLDEPPLVRARRLGEPATLTWDLPRASERRRAEKRSSGVLAKNTLNGAGALWLRQQAPLKSPATKHDVQP